jgi:ATP-dependent helicase HrpB
MNLSLPIDVWLPEIVEAARRERRVVVVAEPGAGKTTRVAPAVVGLLAKESPNLVMLQPRRVAARAAAERIGAEHGWRVGEEVGYHVRFDRKIGPRTRIRVMTEGILTRLLLDDPLLEGVGAVVLDEFHERSIHTDLAAALLKEVRQARPELIVITMSATIDAGPVAAFWEDCPIINVPGRTFPVTVTCSAPSGEALEDRIAGALAKCLTEDESAEETGDVLVFLPGVAEINRTMRAIGALAGRVNLAVLPLHGSLPFEEQARVLRPMDKQKVILATNVAETSLTIDGVRTVIDGGLVRVARYDVRRGLDRLDVQRISNASATQRAGRAGRTAAGRCIRLWTQREQNELEPFNVPEIGRVDLAPTMLTLHAWGRPDVRAFGWFERPDERAIVAAERLLLLLGLTDEADRITAKGQRAAAMPLHPRLGRLMGDAMDAGMGETGATLAAILSEKDIAISEGRPHERVAKTHGQSDVTQRVEMLERAERSRFGAYLREEGIDAEAARQVARVRDELRRIVAGGRSKEATGEKAGDETMDEEAIGRLVLAAYPDRICRRRNEETQSAVMVGGAGAKLANESVVKTAEFFVAVDARADDRNRASEAMVRIASAIDPRWLEELFPQSMVRDRVHLFDEAKQRVVARSQVRYLDLVLREDDDAPVDAEEAAVVLAEALRPRARAWFEADEDAANLLARVRLLREHLPQHPWPAFDDEELADILAEACAGKRSLDQLGHGAAKELLKGRLVYPMDRLIEQHAPETIEVPTGSRMKVDYRGEKPTLAVRLQELFGWTDTPRIAAGKVPVVLHLLGPNYRPVQITQDLRSFWANTYFQVRKDLKARYPKHAWPEDPLTAPPQRKGRSTKA